MSEGEEDERAERPDGEEMDRAGKGRDNEEEEDGEDGAMPCFSLSERIVVHKVPYALVSHAAPTGYRGNE